jgi:hypothetical protein
MIAMIVMLILIAKTEFLVSYKGQKCKSFCSFYNNYLLNLHYLIKKLIKNENLIKVINYSFK